MLSAVLESAKNIRLVLTPFWPCRHVSFNWFVALAFVLECVRTCVQQSFKIFPVVPFLTYIMPWCHHLFHPKDFALAKAKFTGSDGKVDDSKYRNELYGYGVSPLAFFVLFVSLVFVFLCAPVDLEDRDWHDTPSFLRSLYIIFSRIIRFVRDRSITVIVVLLCRMEGIEIDDQIGRSSPSHLSLAGRISATALVACSTS